MNLKMFAVYDSKAMAYLQPFFAMATGVAIRQFSTAANDQEHDFHRHAGDYTLFEIGDFNQDTGRLESLKAPLDLGTAHTLKDPNKPATPIGVMTPQEADTYHMKGNNS